MAENEQKPNSVTSDGTKTDSSNQAEEATSSQHLGNAVATCYKRGEPECPPIDRELSYQIYPTNADIPYGYAVPFICEMGHKGYRMSDETYAASVAKWRLRAAPKD